MSGEWERMPGMQRVITLDGVIYVHENAKRRRIQPAEPNYLEADPEESEPLAEVAAVAAEPVVEAAAEPEPEPVPEPAPEPVAAKPEKQSLTIVRNGWKAPPPGYAIEFGTGRIVPIRSYKGRMT